MDTPQPMEVVAFAPNEVESLKRLSALYAQAKVLILYSEEVDPDSRSNIQVIKELRDAYDHLMRVIAARLTGTIPPLGANEESSDGGCDGYCSKNLDKAIGHVYRAAFDALDGTTLSLKEKIADILEAYPLPVLTAVLPNYWERKKHLNQLAEKVAENRASKDVAGDLANTFDEYVADTEQLSAFYTELLNLGSTLDECKKHHDKSLREEDSRERKNHFVGGLAYKTAFAVAALIAAYLFGQNSSGGTTKVVAPNDAAQAAEMSKVKPSPPPAQQQQPIGHGAKQAAKPQ